MSDHDHDSSNKVETLMEMEVDGTSNTINTKERFLQNIL